jgi:hypothetical protein
MPRYKIDIFHDKSRKLYLSTKFVEAESKECISPVRLIHGTIEYYIVEEDMELEQPMIFFTEITHNYCDGFCDHRDHMKTIYVHANSYKEAAEKSQIKLEEFKAGRTEYNFRLNEIHKDERDPLTILLSI